MLRQIGLWIGAIGFVVLLGFAVRRSGAADDPGERVKQLAARQIEVKSALRATWDSTADKTAPRAQR